MNDGPWNPDCPHQGVHEVGDVIGAHALHGVGGAATGRNAHGPIGKLHAVDDDDGSDARFLGELRCYATDGFSGDAGLFGCPLGRGILHAGLDFLECGFDRLTVDGVGAGERKLAQRLVVIGLGSARRDIPHKRFSRTGIPRVVQIVLDQVRGVRAIAQIYRIIDVQLVQKHVGHGHDECHVAAGRDGQPFAMGRLHVGVRIHHNGLHAALPRIGHGARRSTCNAAWAPMLRPSVMR